MIGDEAKYVALRVYGGFVIERTIFEVEGQMRCHVVSAHYLDEIAIREDLALFRGQRKKTMQRSLGMVRRNRLCRS